MRAILLPTVTPLPAALLQPTPPLLPLDGLLLCTARLLLLLNLTGGLLRLLRLRLLPPTLFGLLALWWLLQIQLLPPLLPRLFGTLFRLSRSSLLDSLLLRLLSGLSVPFLRLVLLFRSAGRRLLRRTLRMLLLLCRWRRTLMLFALLLLGLAPFFVLLVALRMRSNCRSEQQKQGSRSDRSNELHRTVPPSCIAIEYARRPPTTWCRERRIPSPAAQTLRQDS